MEFTNNSAESSSYLWDFCSSDLSAPPTLEELGVLPEASAPFGFKTVMLDGNWHAFVTNRNSNKLLRLDYGQDLSNYPTVVDLGNPENLLTSPEDIEGMHAAQGILTGRGGM